MNKRIDLTQFEGLFEPNLLLHVFEEIKKVGFKDQTTVWAAKMPPIYFGKQTVDAIEMLPDLIAELKRCYEEIDKYEFLYGSSFEEHFWIATCKPDAEGQCSLDIESYEELMELVAADKVEIPEYSHDNNELILHDGCTCGVSHEEWLESKN